MEPAVKNLVIVAHLVVVEQTYGLYKIFSAFQIVLGHIVPFVCVYCEYIYVPSEAKICDPGVTDFLKALLRNRQEPTDFECCFFKTVF